MIRNLNISTAMAMSAAAHEDQVDKADKPYVMHPMRVASNFTDPFQVIVALLHDVLEDSDVVTAQDIENVFGDEIRDAVETLSRKSNDEDYFDYIFRIKPFPQLAAIKLADLRDNMDVLRLDYVIDKDIVRMNKYIKAYNILK